MRPAKWRLKTCTGFSGFLINPERLELSLFRIDTRAKTCAYTHIMPPAKKTVSDILDDTGGCVCLNLRGAARAVTQFYDETLKPSGLKVTQFSVLAAVATGGPASMTAISRTLVMDRTTLTRNLKPLMDRGLVQEKKNSRDHRQRHISLTREGMIALSRALPLWKRAQNQVVNGLGLARWKGMQRLLEEAIHLTGHP